MREQTSASPCSRPPVIAPPTHLKPMRCSHGREKSLADTFLSNQGPEAAGFAVPTDPGAQEPPPPKSGRELKPGATSAPKIREDSAEHAHKRQRGGAGSRLVQSPLDIRAQPVASGYAFETRMRVGAVTPPPPPHPTPSRLVHPGIWGVCCFRGFLFVGWRIGWFRGLVF